MARRSHGCYRNGPVEKGDVSKWQTGVMKTLVEIERAADELPSQRAELLLFLAETIRKEQAPLPEPREFSTQQLQLRLCTCRRQAELRSACLPSYPRVHFGYEQS